MLKDPEKTIGNLIARQKTARFRANPKAGVYFADRRYFSDRSVDFPVE